jgi:hypothetical protein
LKLLNLSRNEIVFIEKDAFCNLNKLNTLDSSSNGPFLKFIEANLFQGLNYLNDLHLNALNLYATLNDSSFNYLSNIGNIYLDWNIVTKYQCLFMNAIVHDVRRKVGTSSHLYRYTFFKSINLLTFDLAENESGLGNCVFPI